MAIVVLGGYGNFGLRISRALAVRGHAVVACGRYSNGHQGDGLGERITTARLDIHDPDFGTALKALGPTVVIHCVGPFQGQDYRVAQAAIAAGAHYIDLADGRAFVSEFPKTLNRQAEDAGVLAVSGASTLPAVSSAVVDSLKARFLTVAEIQISIAPAQRSPRGAATLQAVFSYLGRPLEWWSEGGWKRVYGWHSLRRLQFKRLGRRWAAACDVPDLALMPARYPGVQTVEFRASLEFAVEHCILAGIAGIRRIGIPFPIEDWAGPFDHFARCLDPFGSEEGGMQVSLAGTAGDGRKLQVEWHLTAGWREGPEIPCLPAILLAERLARNGLSDRGARACMGLLSLEDFEPEFRRLGIRTEIIEGWA